MILLLVKYAVYEPDRPTAATAVAIITFCDNTTTGL